MRKRILCFGDSNTWGYIPGKGERYPENVRWTGVLTELLAGEFTVVEEGLNGRTTVFSDRMEPERCGIDHVLPVVLSALPLDYMIIMLGTNDMKSHFHVNAMESGYGMEELLLKVLYVLRTRKSEARVILVSPVPISPAEDPMFDEESVRKSRELTLVYEKLAKDMNLLFLNASKITNDIGLDGIHLTQEGHNKIGKALAELIKSCEKGDKL